MNKSIISISILILLLAISFSAYSKDTLLARNTLLYVKDHTGENFLVLRIDNCTLGNDGELICAMEPQAGASTVKAGPPKGFWAKLSYPKS